MSVGRQNSVDLFVMQRLIRTVFILSIFFCLLNNGAHAQIKQIQQELHRLSAVRDSVNKVNSLNRLGTLYRTRNSDSCFYYGMEAKRLATNIRYQKGQIDADHVIAYALYKKGLYSDALELLSSMLMAYTELHDREKMNSVYIDIAGIQN